MYPKRFSFLILSERYVIDTKPLKIEPNHLFPDIYFGNLISFEINDNQLIAKIGGQIPQAGGNIGDIQIIYVFKDKMYQAKSIKFKPNE